MSAKRPLHQVRRQSPVQAHERASNSTPGGPVATPLGSRHSEGDSGRTTSFAAELRAALDHCKEYPALAKARKQSGRVGVGFTVKKNGQIINAHVVSPCVFDKLNEAAIQTVTRLGNFKPVPDSVSMNDWNVVVPIEFKLQ
ncbi:MAG: energy transducer TonB [Methylotenera sp.]|nr:energy transducer TonB [Oligoflexia bacterium]